MCGETIKECLSCFKAKCVFEPKGHTRTKYHWQLHERLKVIAQEYKANPHVSKSELSRKFNVSRDTVRRALRYYAV